MGLFRKLTSVSTLGLVHFLNEDEKQSRYARQTRNALRRLERLERKERMAPLPPGLYAVEGHLRYWDGFKWTGRWESQ